MTLGESYPLLGKRATGSGCLCFILSGALALVILIAGTLVAWKHPGQSTRFRREPDIISIEESIGLPRMQWLPVSFEVEMRTLTGTNDAKNTAGVVKDALSKADGHGDRHGTINSTRLAVLREVAVGDSTHRDGEQNAWTWAADNGNLELDSPWYLSEAETAFAASASGLLSGKFKIDKNDVKGDQGTGLHVHVASSCLLKDERRLVGLLLIWERFYSAIIELTHAQRGKAIVRYAPPISTKNPSLLEYLQNRWEAEPEPLPESLEAGFRRLAASTTTYDGKDWTRTDTWDGYRRFAVNVCHLLDVPCCWDCPKNLTPKFGSLEFRLFDSALGQGLLSKVALSERIVQASCARPLEEMRQLLLTEGTSSAPLLKFLKLDQAEFK